jgi:hypothetical protein
MKKLIIPSLVVWAWLAASPAQATELFGARGGRSGYTQIHGSCWAPRGYTYHAHRAPRGSYWGRHEPRRHHHGDRRWQHAYRGQYGHGKHRQGGRHYRH